MIEQKQLLKTIEWALAEDVCTGDITTQCTVPEGMMVSGNFIAKSSGILCGMDIAKSVFHTLTLISSLIAFL